MPFRIRARSLGAAAIATTLTTGCAFLQVGEQTALKYMGAEELKLEKTDYATADGQASSALVGYLIGDSLHKCSRFMDRLLLGRGSFNYVSDTTTSLLSAAAAITTPVSVARGLAAGSTVVGASKNSFDSEFFVNASSGTLQLAIAKTYFSDMRNYIERLSRIPRDEVRADMEIPLLQQVHANCRLGAAQSTVQATLQGASPQSGPSAAPPASAASAAQSAASAARAAASAAQAAAAAAAAAPPAVRAPAIPASGAAYPITPVLPGSAIQVR